MNRTGIHIILVLMLISALTCCTKVGYEHDIYVENVLPTSTKIAINYDWSVLDSLYPDDSRQGMYVAMSRVVDEKHYVYYTDQNGLIVNENIVGTSVNEGDSISRDVEHGTYYVMAFNYDPDDVSVAGFEDFSTSNTSSMKNIVVTVPHMSIQDKEEKYPTFTTDYNSALEYLDPIDKPIYFDSYRKTFQSGDTLGLLNIRPAPLTQKIVFNFELALEGNVEVETSYASLSGVTESIELMSGVVQDSAIYQTVVDFELSKTPTRVDSKGDEAYNVHILTGVVYTFGLLPPESSKERRGPGILNLTLKVKVGNKKHSFHVGFNLYEFIMMQNFFEFRPDGSGYSLLRREAPSQYDFGSTIYLSEEFVIECAEGLGAEEWIYDEEGDIEIEI
jgi:hypothetical protein